MLLSCNLVVRNIAGIFCKSDEWDTLSTLVMQQFNNKRFFLIKQIILARFRNWCLQWYNVISVYFLISAFGNKHACRVPVYSC